MRAIAYIIVLFIASASAIVEIPCEFAHTPRGYECRLPDVDLSIFPEFAISGGTHLANQNDNTVVSFMSVHNNFREFPTSDLVRFPNLRQIHISGSEITELLPYAVANRPTLESLNLQSNFIDRIDLTAFNGTGGITELNLMLNRFRSIDNAIFAMFPNLLVLDLSFNLIERIPANALVFNPSLTSINLNSNRISHVNQSFFDNVLSLTTLFFHANLCYSGSFFNVHIPGNRFDMFNRLQQCFIDTGVLFRCTFGYEFGGIEFDQRYTCLLRGIEAYDYNKPINLGGIHQPGRNNANVQQVWIDSSNVRFFIRQLFATFTNLHGVHITSGGLQMLRPNSFQGATQLRVLTFLLNNIRGLEADSFQHANNLEIIQLFHNNVEYINANAFRGLLNLRELWIVGGSLEYIPPDTFGTLINLHLVDFSQNNFGIIDSRWFANNTLLSQISFNLNVVYAIHPSLVDKPLLTTLRLRENVCVNNVFSITPATREQVRTALNPCFEAYPLRRQVFTMILEGDMNILDENGTVVGAF